MPIIKEERLSSYPTNFKAVKGEVNDAMQYDWKRDKVDDAKKRAIYDSRNYDDFKSRVATCTLKPIHRNEFNAPPKFVYNRGALQKEEGARRQQLAGCTAVDQAALEAARRTSAAGTSLPKNAREFERELRRRPTAIEKVRLIEPFDGDTCANLFGRELDAEVLRQLLVAMEEADVSLMPGVTRQFLALLAARCPSSTSTAASFLTAEDRGIVIHLLLRERIDDPSQDVRICAAFGVPPPPVEAYQEIAAAATNATADSRSHHSDGDARNKAVVEEDEAPSSGEVNEQPAVDVQAVTEDEGNRASGESCEGSGMADMD